MDNELRERAQAFLRMRPDLTTKDLAAHTCLGYSTITNYMAGLRPATERIEREVARVLALAEAGEILQPAGGLALVVREGHAPVKRVRKEHGWYKTEFVRCVAEVMDYCVEHAEIGLITADYGTGKTEAAAAWRRGGAESVVVEFNEFTASNKISCLQAIAAALGLPTRCPTADGARLFELIVRHLLDNPCLLIFDQCEMCRPRILQVVRQIWDRTRTAGVGAVLLAAPVLLLRLKDSRMLDLGALESRIGVMAPLAGLRQEEMAAIVRQEGLAQVDDEAFRVWWRATGGSMRRLLKSLEMLLAKHAGKPVTAKTIRGVASTLWGVRCDAA